MRWARAHHCQNIDGDIRGGSGDLDRYTIAAILEGEATMTDTDLKQSILDAEHLRLLSTGCFVSAGAGAFLSLFGLMHILMGARRGVILFPASRGQHAKARPRPVAGGMFGLFSGVVHLFGAGMATAKFPTGRDPGQRRSRTFCQRVARVSCLSTPFGTTLDLAAFPAVGKPSASALFEDYVAAGSGLSKASA